MKTKAYLVLISAVILVLTLSCAGSTPATESTPQPTPSSLPVPTEDGPLFSTFGWKTDFTKHSVPYSEILSGGVGKDGIPPIYNPKFESVLKADAWLSDGDPVAFLQIDEQVRAYPLRILIWHEIVNDEFAGVPVAVTYCPLCNTVVVLERRLQGKVYTFGVSGLLRNSDLIMWDHETESLWQQATGEAVVGELIGQSLSFLSSSIISWNDFKVSFPDGEVLSRDTGYPREYGLNPYFGYDTLSFPFLFKDELDPRLAAMERVIGVTIGGESVAYPFSVLAELGAVNDSVGEKKLVIFYSPGTVSPLDESIIETSREIGSVVVFYPTVEGKTLTFEWSGGQIVDRETLSSWNIFGRATEGPLKSEELEPVIHGTHFWFAWAAFNPDTIIYQP